MNITKREIERITKQHQKECIDIAKQIWEKPEESFSEFNAYNLILSSLKKHGFTIKPSALKTSIVATFSVTKENTSVGILGEYDALYGTSADGIDSNLGHGCGHNLLGAGSLLSAIVLSKLIKKYSLNTKIIYYGCPAEESGAGKILMLEDNLFQNVDACFTWHPAAKNAITNDIWIGSKIIRVNFIGKEAHASMSQSGISANDLMVKLINYLHKINLKDCSYIINPINQHLSLTPAKASMDIGIRSFKDNEISNMYKKIKTFMHATFKKSEYKIIEVEEYPITHHDIDLQDIVFESFKLYNEQHKFTRLETKYSNKILSSISKKDQIANLQSMNIPITWQGKIMKNELLYSKEVQYIYAPTDVGAISKVIPTIQFQTVCMPLGVSVHTKEATLCTNTSIGYKGMVLASKVISTSILQYTNNTITI